MSLRVIWQYMDRSIYCHMTLSAMNYLLYIHLVMSRDLNIELLPISTENIWKLCGLELKDILIQQEFNCI